MRIGSSYIPPQLPSRPQQRPADALAASGDALASRSPSQGGERAQVLRSVEANFQRVEDSGFYSMERDLSLRSQEALNAYITTERYQTAPGQGELMGVDIYV